MKSPPRPSCLCLSGCSDSQGAGSPGQGRVHCPLWEGVWTRWKVFCSIGPCVRTARSLHVPTHTYLYAPINPWAFPAGMLIPSTEIPCLSSASLKGELPEGRDLVWFPFDCSAPLLCELIHLERSTLILTGSEALDDKSMGWSCSLLWTAGRPESCLALRFVHLICFTSHWTVSSSHCLQRAVWWTGCGLLVVQLVWIWTLTLQLDLGCDIPPLLLSL